MWLLISQYKLNENKMESAKWVVNGEGFVARATDSQIPEISNVLIMHGYIE